MGLFFGTTGIDRDDEQITTCARNPLWSDSTLPLFLGVAVFHVMSHLQPPKIPPKTWRQLGRLRCLLTSFSSCVWSPAVVLERNWMAKPPTSSVTFKWEVFQRMWGFPKIVVPQNGWVIMENLIKMDDLGGYPTIFGKIHVCIYQHLPKLCQLNPQGCGIDTTQVVPYAL